MQVQRAAGAPGECAWVRAHVGVRVGACGCACLGEGEIIARLSVRVLCCMGALLRGCMCVCVLCVGASVHVHASAFVCLGLVRGCRLNL